MNTSVTESDVVIVGAGMSATLMSAKLSAAGKQVVLLEAGPERKGVRSH